jgi:hypothetical protein
VSRGTLTLLGAEGADAARWQAALETLPQADIYFTPAYTRLLANLDGDEPLGALWESDRGRALFPLQIRPLVRLPLWSSRWLGAYAEIPAFDAVSPYGYSGPLTHLPQPEASVLIKEFLDALGEELRARRVVSLFVRLHPLVGNAVYFPRDAIDLARRTETVFINLTTPWYKGLTSACRYEVRKSERRGVEVEAAEDPDDWRAFGDLYRITMRRRGARDWYFFPQAFLEDTRRLLGLGVTLLVARREGSLVGGSLFLEGFGKGHYHLSGTSPEASGLGVSNRLIVEGARRCEGHGCATFHLGGGQQPGDGLSRFKASFSPLRTVWDKASVVIDPQAYGTLVEGRGRYLRDQGVPEGAEAGGPFPAYRHGVEDLAPPRPG